jgi:prolyl-tRNA synthetase
MGLKAMAIRADTGAIGGDLSHEFHILANTGESTIYYDKKFEEIADSIDLNSINEKFYELYADEYCEKFSPTLFLINNEEAS